VPVPGDATAALASRSTPGILAKVAKWRPVLFDWCAVIVDGVPEAGPANEARGGFPRKPGKGCTLRRSSPRRIRSDPMRQREVRMAPPGRSELYANISDEQTWRTASTRSISLALRVDFRW